MVLRHAIIATELELIPEIPSIRMVWCQWVDYNPQVTHLRCKEMQHASSRHHYSSNHHSLQSLVRPSRHHHSSQSLVCRGRDCRGRVISRRGWDCVNSCRDRGRGRGCLSRDLLWPLPCHPCRHLHNHMALNTQAFVSSAHVDINGCSLLSSNGVRP